MTRALRLLIAATIVAPLGADVGCSEPSAPVGLTPDEVVAQIAALPGVTVTEPDPAVKPPPTDYHYYLLHFTEPVDHDDPTKGTFQLKVSLLHRSSVAAVPVVVQTTGYADNDENNATELATILAANQIAIEHRYYGTSMPQPAVWDDLSVRQAAADEHDVIAALRAIYGGAFVSTGASKGGMTAVFHHRWYPDDVVGTVAYVAPISFGAPDERYRDHMQELGPVGCHAAVRTIAVEMLVNRRQALAKRALAQPDHTYTKIQIDAAVEAAVVGLEWAFWQAHGYLECSTVPLPSASDDQVFAFLDAVSAVRNHDDKSVNRSQPYYYQSYTQLGYPDGDTDDYLKGFLGFTDDDYLNELPTGEPLYDGKAMIDINDYVESEGRHFLFIYGEWDPWTGGKFSISPEQDGAVMIVPKGNHKSLIQNLERADHELAFAKLETWTGVVPVASRVPVKPAAAAAQDEALSRVHPPREEK